MVIFDDGAGIEKVVRHLTVVTVGDNVVSHRAGDFGQDFADTLQANGRFPASLFSTPSHVLCIKPVLFLCGLWPEGLFQDCLPRLPVLGCTFGNQTPLLGAELDFIWVNHNALLRLGL